MDGIFPSRELKGLQSNHFPSILDQSRQMDYDTYFNSQGQIHSQNTTLQNNSSVFPNVKPNRSLSVGVFNRPNISYNPVQPTPFTPIRSLSNAGLPGINNNGFDQRDYTQANVFRSQSAIFTDKFPGGFNNNMGSTGVMSPLHTPSQITSPTSPNAILDPKDYFNHRSMPITRRNSDELTESLTETPAFFIGESIVSKSNEVVPFSSRKASAPNVHFKEANNVNFMPFDPKFRSNYTSRISSDFLNEDTEILNYKSPTSPLNQDLFRINDEKEHQLPTLPHDGIRKAKVDTFNLENPMSNNNFFPSHFISDAQQNNMTSINDQAFKPMTRARSATHFADLYTAKAHSLNFDQARSNNFQLNQSTVPFAPTMEQIPNGVCRFYVQGHCTKGSRCLFKHIPKEALTRGAIPPKASCSMVNNMQYNIPVGQTRTLSNMSTTTTSVHDQASLILKSPPTSSKLNSNAPSFESPIYLNGNYKNRALNTTKLNNEMKEEFFQHDPPVDFKALSKDFAQYIGKIASLCLDQHGCRFLQKKLEEKRHYQTQIIFAEVSTKFAELMSDPFGNYLCQKLMEHCDTSQRFKLVEVVSAHLVTISMNMHGTRAVQKMIDFLVSTADADPKPSIECITNAIKGNVVSLIKDLNGNHVIQKCINRLSPEQNQFIYDSVSINVVEVATHRHGCCVLQRCIDYASESQKMQLATAITKASFKLVQDPFGNYVVQYVLDLNDLDLTNMMIQQFKGSICSLSVQKFSSNVIEKCIRKAEKEIRYELIQELLNRDRLDLLIRDSYANYVVQTCLEFAEEDQRNRLINCIKPLLNSVRGTSYAKRIQSRIQRNPLDSEKPANTTNHSSKEQLLSTKIEVESSK